jgi:4a-hydroxytetrahydrobiopterin dehydratase
MTVQTCDVLRAKKCVPCEGGVPKLTPDEAQQQIKELTGWQLVQNIERIRKEWRVKNFVAGMKFLNQVCDLAEAEGHHPDVHIEGYRNLAIEIWTHAIGGLSENDFILAAKIDLLPIELAKS